MDLPNRITCEVTMAFEGLVIPTRAHQPELASIGGLTITEVDKTSEARVDLDPMMASMIESTRAV